MRDFLFKYWIVFICLTSIIQFIKADEYFVDNDRDIRTTMQNLAQPGDTLTMRSGVWTDQEIVFTGYGAEGDSILLRAEDPGEVIINGTSTLRMAGDYLKVDGLYFKHGYANSGHVVEFRYGSHWAQHCRLTNTAIINYNPPNLAEDYKWISLYGKYNRVDHCYLEGKKHTGTTLVVWLSGEPNYHRIDHNHFGHRPPLGRNEGETIRVGTSTHSMSDSYTTVERNYFEHCNGEIEIISSKSNENIYRYNTFYECEGSLTLRHGNKCTVEGNFFFGNGNNLAGGVRVIGEDHKVINNYFSGLYGGSLKSALPIMNGVPNSPLNRYFQVKRALIAFNTFVDCRNTMIIGAGADNERTLPPQDCVIANNIVKTRHQIIEQEAEPDNLQWEGNLMAGESLGITKPDGITLTDPGLYFAEDSLWRLSQNSPAIDAAAGNYDFVTEDMDGQTRDENKDAGADELSDNPIVRRPIFSDDVGLSWEPRSHRIISVGAGQDSLYNAVESAIHGDILVLTTDAGVYSNSQVMKIAKKIKIKAKSNLKEMPLIWNNGSSSSDRKIFEILNDGNLYLKGVELEGGAETDNPVKNLISTAEDPLPRNYKLKVDSCYLQNVANVNSGPAFIGFKGTFADSIIFTDCIFENIGNRAISLIDEEKNSGEYNVNYLGIDNSTFSNIAKEAVVVYGGDDIMFTDCPVIRVNHCTFNNCGYDSTGIIDAEQVDFTKINNCIFSYSPQSLFTASLYGQGASIAHCDTFDTGLIKLFRNARAESKTIWGAKPYYENRENSNYTLLPQSHLYEIGNDGLTLGDRRWAVNDPLHVFLNVDSDYGVIEFNPKPIALSYDPSTQISIEAKPDSNYKFESWSGDISSTNNPLTFEINEDMNIKTNYKTVSNMEEEHIPAEFYLKQNYPNPFNSSTRIDYSIAKSGSVTLQIFNINGESITELVNDFKRAGKYSVVWTPKECATGIYICRLISGRKTRIRKILVVK